MNNKKTIAIGMSGGVDSSVAAYLLKKQGYNVIGLFMKNWEDDSSTCTAKQDLDDVSKVCAKLDIAYYSLNFTDEYYKKVFSKCLDDFKTGITPNPDILCNKEIKFKLFLKKALMLEVDYLATGHYAQKELINNQYHLLKGKDPKKDQSYFLYTLKSDILKKVIFPLGNLTKKEVRKIAQEIELPNADKKDSTGICFIGKRKFKDFLSSFLPFTPGKIQTVKGKEIAQHQGLSFYTIGQRKGLGIGGEGDAWYVVKKDVKNNILIVDQGKDTSALLADKLIAKDPSWICDKPEKFPYECTAKIRYRQADQKCIIEKIENNILHIGFPEKQRAITPGQSIVFYKDAVCLGGAVIIE